MIFYRISELKLATLIQRYDKNHFISRTRDKLTFYRLSGAAFYDCINTIYQFTKTLLDNKMSTFEECGAFNVATTLFRCPGIATITDQIVYTTSAQRRCNVMTLYRRWDDVVLTSCACWVLSACALYDVEKALCVCWPFCFWILTLSMLGKKISPRQFDFFLILHSK